jgi:hypothetical protein
MWFSHFWATCRRVLIGYWLTARIAVRLVTPCQICEDMARRHFEKKIATQLFEY